MKTRILRTRRARAGRYVAAPILTLIGALSLQLSLGEIAAAQQALPGIDVKAVKKKRARKPAPSIPRQQETGSSASGESQGQGGAGVGAAGGSLTVPNTAQATVLINRAPGAVEVVPATQYRDTPAKTLKDALEYVPGVMVQPKWGEDSRLSIRGSGLSRNFHLRSLQLFMDGIPINTADGYGDLQEIDPTAFRYIEVYKGANALRYGANSLGGAINFVTPTGRDADVFESRLDIGSFGFRRLHASSGGAVGAWDYFITGSWLQQEGFRDHSDGESLRGSANIGYRFSANAETRFFFNGNTIDQRIPGAVTKSTALSSPTTAAPNNLLLDQQRNIDSGRIGNMTTLRFDQATLEVGAFGVQRHLMHPIYQWLDYEYQDYGAFSRLTDEHSLGGFKNRLIAGLTLHNGSTDAKNFQDLPGAKKGALLASSIQDSENLSVYAEDSFYFIKDVALVAGTQFLHATREQHDRFLANGDQSGSNEFNLWSPKVGLLWDIDRNWQGFANISRSSEVPSFGENNYTNVQFSSIKPQTATTYEIGTRGKRPGLTWDLSLYHAAIDDELQCFDVGTPGSCTVVNADKTVHQGVEAGVGFGLDRVLGARGKAADRLWLNLSYTLNDFHYDGDAKFGDNQLPGAPMHFLRSELLYKDPSGVYFGPNIEWVPQSFYVDAANTVKTEPYAIWGLKLGFDNGKNFSAFVEGRNLGDLAYIASASVTKQADSNSMLFEPGTGRAFYAGVQFKW